MKILRVSILGLLLLPVSSIAGINEDQDSVQNITMCFNNVYQAKPYSPYVYQRDIDDLNRADQKLRTYLRRNYSKKDAADLFLVGMVEGDSKKPKPNIPPIEIVKTCRKIVEMIDARY